MICPACFQEKVDAFVCPHCGYDENAPQSPLLLPPGTALFNGQYLVGKILGKPGGFGITYLGWDSQLATFVAIKEFLPRDLAGRHFDHLTVSAHTDGDAEAFRYGMEQFLHEARTLAQFDHPNVVRVRAFFQENGTAYLVMDYLEGESLADYLQKMGGNLSEKASQDIILPVLDGLKEVHAKGFLHRDIKPQNIYITKNGRPILLDFGTARLAMTEKSRGMTTILTPGYAPWEQYHRHGKQGAWTDIYACAATLYHMVTGVVPSESAERVAQDDLVAPIQIVPTLSPHFSLAIMRALSIDPANRPQTIAEFQTALTASGIPNAPGVSVLPPPSSVRPQQPPPISYSPPPPSYSQPPPPPPTPPAVPNPQYMPPPVHQSGPPMRPPGQATTSKSPVGKIIALIAVLVIAGGGFMYYYNTSNGFRTMPYNGGTYEGNVSWGSPSGQGKLSSPTFGSYNGLFDSGKRSGKGTQIYPDGSNYSGEWKDDKRNGQGNLTYKDGSTYAGEWKDDKRDGQGVLTSKDGSKYTGPFKSDAANGKGTLNLPNGDKYEGDFVNGVRTGQGVLTYQKGGSYTGGFRDGKREGQGTNLYPNGTKYVGEYKNDKRNGQGTQSLISGGVIVAEYVGEYREDVPYSPNGQYKLILKDGRVTYATYRDGTFYYNN